MFNLLIDNGYWEMLERIIGVLSEWKSWIERSKSLQNKKEGTRIY